MQPTALQTYLIKVPGVKGPAEATAGHVLHLLFLQITSMLNKLKSSVVESGYSIPREKGRGDEKRKWERGSKGNRTIHKFE